VRTHGDDPDVLTRLGYLHQLRGDFEPPERLYDRALRADPDRAVVAANLGLLYVRKGMLTRAVALWRPAFAKNPQLTELGVNLGRALCADGDHTGARQVLQRVLQQPRLEYSTPTDGRDGESLQTRLRAKSAAGCRSAQHDALPATEVWTCGRVRANPARPIG
jgi:tetratricopeptide (TPR) repeat protein